MEMLPDALVIAAADGRIVAASATAEQLFAYEPGELVGQDRGLLPERQVGARQLRCCTRGSPALAVGRARTSARTVITSTSA
jgi:PAS domain-containing protein